MFGTWMLVVYQDQEKISSIGMMQAKLVQQFGFLYFVYSSLGCIHKEKASLERL